jgi:hypothetical protein
VRSRPLEDNDAGVEFVHQEPVRFEWHSRRPANSPFNVWSLSLGSNGTS